MTTITLEHAFMIRVLEQLDVAQSLLERSQHHAKIAAMYKELRAALSAPATAPDELERKPMTDEEVIDLVRECGLDWHKGFMPLFDDDPTNRFAVLVRAVEASHDIKDAP